MSEGTLYFFTKPDPNRPIEEQYVAEINNKRRSFVNEDDAMLHLFDNGVITFRRLTKEINEYVNIKTVPLYEFWHIENRVGYVTYDNEPYIDEDNNVKKRKAYVWRFIGFGRPCFGKDKEELTEKVSQIIIEHGNAPSDLGYNKYPYYTKHYRD